MTTADSRHMAGTDSQPCRAHPCARRLALPGAALAVALVALSPAVASAAARIDSGPAAFTNNPDAIVTFDDPANSAASFFCSIDVLGPRTPCTSPKAYQGLSENTHTFYLAETTDGPAAATRTWTVDLTPPNTVLDSGPPAATNQTSADFAFHSADSTATFQCSLNFGPWAACTSPRHYGGLSNGTRQFSVRAVDPAGNIDPAPPGTSWTVDTTPPTTTIATGPGGQTTTHSASFTFTSSKSNSTFACSLDGAAFAACPTPYTVNNVADGAHTLAVQATDSLGNTDPSPPTRSWTVSATAPAPPSLIVTTAKPLVVGKKKGRPFRPPSARPSSAGPGSGTPTTEPFLLTTTGYLSWHSSDSSTATVKVYLGDNANPNNPTLASGFSGVHAITLSPGTGECYTAIAFAVNGLASAPTVVCTQVPETAGTLIEDTLGDFSDAAVTPPALITDPLAFGGAYAKLTAGDVLARPLAGCAYFGDAGGCLYASSRLVAVIASTCNACGSVRVEMFGFHDPYGHASQTYYSYTLKLTSPRLRRRQLRYIPIPVAASEAEYDLRITRASGEPRIEGLAFG